MNRCTVAIITKRSILVPHDEHLHMCENDQENKVNSLVEGPLEGWNIEERKHEAHWRLRRLKLKAIHVPAVQRWVDGEEHKQQQVVQKDRAAERDLHTDRERFLLIGEPSPAAAHPLIMEKVIDDRGRKELLLIK